MLVLTRRGDQSIVFPELDVTVQILRVRGNVVKVGIDAPRDVTVLRKEVLDDPNTIVPRSRRETLNHEIRGHVHQAKLAAALLSRKIELGMSSDVENELASMLRGLENISQIVSDPIKAKPVETTGQKEASVRALLVEDDVNQSELLAGYLKLSGFDVSVAGDGVDALDHLANDATPDVVLLDMQMPRLNGPETVSRIRNTPHLEGLRVFAVSGTCPMEFGVPEGPNGIDRWFPKPLDPETLVRTLKTELTVTV